MGFRRFKGPDWTDPPFEVTHPPVQSIPFIYNSPHSGAHYSEVFLASSNLGLDTLRHSEDAFVDEIFAAAPGLGAPLMAAHFPRAYLDVNREPYELDPEMFEDALPPHANTGSRRVAGGLGTIARLVADGKEIYRNKLSLAEVEHRIQSLHVPYHQRLSDLMDETTNRFGYAVLVDCHSMPGPGRSEPPLPDVILGDRYGASCAPLVTATARRLLESMGYTVGRNTPYAGGYSTRLYGRPGQGMHAIQVELSRTLYLNLGTPGAMERTRGFDKLAVDMTNFMEGMAAIEPGLLRVPELRAGE